MIVRGYSRYGDTASDVSNIATTTGGLFSAITRIFTGGTGGSGQQMPVKPADGGFPTTIALIGGGVLVAGIAAYALTKSRR